MVLRRIQEPIECVFYNRKIKVLTLQGHNVVSFEQVYLLESFIITTNMMPGIIWGTFKK